MSTTLPARDRLRRITVCGGVITMLAAAPLSAQTGSDRYRFTTVLDSLRDGLAATRCAAINTSGTVAVQAQDLALEFNKLVTRRSAQDMPVVVADTQRFPNFPTLCDNGFSQITSDPSINELGEVAFQGNLRRLSTATACTTPPQTDTPRQGVFLGQGGHRAGQLGIRSGPVRRLADGSLPGAVPQLHQSFRHAIFPHVAE
jgi:hypothetical protein